jgi:putative hemolysin
VRELELEVGYDPALLHGVPAHGPLVVVANHPFGVRDGIVIGHLLAQVRPDFKILTHSRLCRVPELRPRLLPIDFTATPAATATNLRTRAEALSWLCAGGALVVFPGGAVSTSEHPFARRAVDPEWKLFTPRAIARARATVVPVFFDDQNSRLLQVASHLSQTLRLALLLYEVCNKIGSAVEVRIGAPVPYDALSHLGDRREMVGYLRRATYELVRAALRPVRSGRGRAPGARRCAAWWRVGAAKEPAIVPVPERAGARSAQNLVSDSCRAAISVRSPPGMRTMSLGLTRRP